MPESVAESWARLRLVQGDSKDRAIELSARDVASFVVGSAPDSSWVVHDPSVRSEHFMLHWDGATLRVADRQGAGDVRVDGQPLTTQWRVISGRVRIEFGNAAMVAETAALAVAGPQPPGPMPALAANEAAVGGASASRKHKATLIGVAAHFPAPGSDPPTSAERSELVEAPERPETATPVPFSGARPEADRVRKATLLGVAMNLPAGASKTATASVGAAANREPEPADAPGAVAPAQRAALTGTLLGVANPVDALRGAQRFVATSEPNGNVTAQPSWGSAQAGADLASGRAVSAGAITQDEVPAVEVPRIGVGGRVAGVWQEAPASVAERAGRGVLNTVAAEAGSAPHFEHGAVAPDPRRRALPRHEATSVASQEKRTFPWRYVGIAVLTAVAYVAWLYLLDHL